jgi:hypothetical protein
MTDTTHNFDPIPRLQQIATTIREVGGIADIFASPATSAYDIECAIKEIERLRRDYSCICNEMRRMMEERDEARRELCAARRELCRNEAIIRLQRNRVHRDSEDVVGLAKEIAVERGWDCFKENSND